MKRITQQEYEIAKKYGLLYDGKNNYPGLNKNVQRKSFLGRSYVRTCHGAVYVTEGRDGIYDSILYFLEKEAKSNGGSK